MKAIMKICSLSMVVAALAVCGSLSVSADGFMPQDVNKLPREKSAASATQKSQAVQNLRHQRTFIPKIIGGSNAVPGEFPHQVSLMFSSDFDSSPGLDRHFCGGSIVGDEWVLTAAHCVQSMIGDQEFYSIGAGSIDLNQLEEYKLDGIWIHPKYDGASLDYDFAIIRVNRPLFDKEIQIVSRADNHFIKAGNVATITGWGVDASGTIQQILQKVNVKIVSRNDCNDADSYDGAVTSRMICLGLEVGGKDSCQGDSGGPALTAVANGAKVLFANVSWGFGCAEPEKFGVYGRLIAVRRWIDSVLP